MKEDLEIVNSAKVEVCSKQFPLLAQKLESRELEGDRLKKWKTPMSIIFVVILGVFMPYPLMSD